MQQREVLIMKKKTCKDYFDKEILYVNMMRCTCDYYRSINTDDPKRLTEIDKSIYDCHRTFDKLRHDLDKKCYKHTGKHLNEIDPTKDFDTIPVKDYDDGFHILTGDSVFKRTNK